MRAFALFFSTAALIAVATFTIRSATAFPLQAPPADGRRDAAGPPRARDLGQQLIAGLKATPGCLGVDSGNTDSGKNVIFAWFENKRAVVAWLESDVHKTARGHFGFPPPDADYTPLAGVADDAGPLMCVAAVTFPTANGAKPDSSAESSTDGGSASRPPMPLFSIEVYTPVTPGLRTAPSAGFAPAEVAEIFAVRQKDAARPATGGK